MNTTVNTAIYHDVPQIMFSWLDYGLFSGMLGLSGLIGVYFGCFGKKQNTKNEYLLGGRTMSVFPVAMSLIASHTSGTSLLAVPADIYKYGTTYWWICISIIISSITAFYVFMPIFVKLQLISTYEYLKLRFNSRVRTLASFLFAISVLLYNPIIIYVPALAFSQATGLNLHLITPIVCSICIFYTTIGGLKAVIWTDTLQSISIAICMAIVLCLGYVSAGGIVTIWEKSLAGDRLDLLDFDLDPTRRGSFWALAIGYTAHWMTSFCIHQGTVQRFLAVPSIREAKRMIIIFCIGMVIVKTISVFTGLIIYTIYADCDPLSTKQITRHDQLLPYYVMDVAGKIPGLPGLFIAGVFSAALSTLSTSLNNLAATIYEDFVSPYMPTNISQKRQSNILKLIVVVTGSICTALVFVVEQLGGVVPLVASLSGITGGPLLGLFCLGMLFPKATSEGAFYGGIGGLVFCSWMIFGNQWYKRKGILDDFSKPVSTSGCPFFLNVTASNHTFPDNQPFILYRISFWYYGFIGAFVTIVLGLVVSCFSKNKSPVNLELISPAVYCLLGKDKSANAPPTYCSVDKALHLVALNSEKGSKSTSDD